MKKIFLFSLFCLFTFGSLPVQAFNFSGDRNDPITEYLGIGEAMRFGDTRIRFLQVISDSRCPRQVTCIRAGEAKILLGIYVAGKDPVEVEMLVNSAEQLLPVLKAAGLKLRVAGLSPYPETPVPISQDEYLLGVRIAPIPAD